MIPLRNHNRFTAFLEPAYSCRVEHPSEDLDGYRFDALQVAALVRLALREDHWAEGLEMVRALRRKDLAALLPIAEPLVSSRYRRRRRVGAVLCGAFAASSLADRAEALLSSLFDDQDLGVASAALALATLVALDGGAAPEVIDALRGHLHHPNPEVRKHARWGLREWRKQQAGTGPGDVTPGASGP